MTTPIIPDYVLQVLEAEMASISWVVIEKLCTFYNLDKNDVQSKLKDFMFTKLDIETNELIRIVRCKPRHEKPSEERCKAYVGTVLDMKQCKNSKCFGFHFCKTHQKKFDAGTLKFGHMNIPPPPVLKKAVLKK